MSLVLKRSDEFWADMLRQVDWYRDNASPKIAERYIDAVEFTLGALIKTPGLGRPRFVGWPELAGFRSWKVQRPYQRHLIFTVSTAKNCLLNESCMVRVTCLAFYCGCQLMRKRDTLALPENWEETKMLKHGDTLMRFLKLVECKTYTLDNGKAPI